MGEFRAPMGRLIRAAALWALFLAACHAPGTAPGLHPAALTFSPAYVGLDNPETLSFTYDGKPLSSPQFTPPASSSAAAWRIAAGGPLGSSSPKLICKPSATGDSDAALTFTADGRSFRVPLHVHAIAPPTCSPPPDSVDQCHEPAFDPSQQQCGVAPVPDGQVCAVPPSCQPGGPTEMSMGKCLSGKCLVPGVSSIPACQMSAMPQQLLPAWTYDLGTDSTGDVQASPVVDAAGNVYWPVVVSSQQATEDIVALDPQGALLWRQSIPIRPDVAPNAPNQCNRNNDLRLTVAGHALIAFTPCFSATLQAWSTVDGTPLWSDTTPVYELVNAGNGQLFAMEGDGVTTGPGLLVLDAATGGHLAEIARPMPYFWRFISDGRGTVFGTDLNTSDPRELMAANRSGVAWTIAASEPPVPVATDETHLFVSDGSILNLMDGSTLFAPAKPESISAAVAAGGRAYEVASAPGGCGNTIQRVDPSSGQIAWQCESNAIGLPAQLVMTAAGGVAVIQGDNQVPHVWIYSEDGSLVSEAMASQLSWRTVVTNHRWLQMEQSIIASYQFAALALAQ